MNAIQNVVENALQGMREMVLISELQCIMTKKHTKKYSNKGKITITIAKNKIYKHGVFEVYYW